MPFRMRRDCDQWFQNIYKPPIDTGFDYFYLCFMLGVAAERRSDPAPGSAYDLTQDFVGQFKPYQRLIVGLLVRSELGSLGVSVKEKENVRKVLNNLLDPMDSSNLTDHGMNVMNAYASGGYEYLVQKLGSKPYHLEEFVRTYIKLLREAADQSSTPKPSKHKSQKHRKR